MKRSAWVALILLGACSPDDGSSVPAGPFVEFEMGRAVAADEWRDARRVGGEGAVAIDLGAVSPGSALRFGFFDESADRARGRIRVYAGRERVHQSRLDGRGGWRDERVELGGVDGAAVRLVIETARPVWIGPCEVVMPAAAPPPSRPNVLVVLIDTLRQDHTSAFGYARDTTPALHALAADGTLCAGLMPSSSWTRPSVASLFTSMHPNYHGAQTINDKLREGLPSLAASLGAAGYETQAFMGNSNCIPTWGFGDDFARFVDSRARSGANDPRDPVAADLAIAAIEHMQGRPWYVYVHAMGPHKPYEPPEPFKTRFTTDVDGLDGDAKKLRTLIDRYDGEIAHTDYQLSRIVAALKRTRQYDNTLIVVLSDHGEEFQEHGGWEHGWTLYEEVLRVPLVIKPPLGTWSTPGRMDELVEMVDIAPTILDIAGIESPSRFQGRSFLPLLRGESEPARVGYAALNLRRQSQRAAKSGDQKYIRDVAAGTEAWYDLAVDPKELQPISVPDALGVELKQQVTTLSLGGASGLHVLMIAGGWPREATVILDGSAVGEVSTHQFEWENTMTRDGKRLKWELTDRAFRPEPPSAPPSQAAFRVHARLNADVAPDAEIRLEVLLDGSPIASERVHLGQDRRHDLLERDDLRAWNLAAHPDDFDLAKLPEEVGVYVWYVVEPVSVSETEMPENVRESLRALGYVE